MKQILKKSVSIIIAFIMTISTMNAPSYAENISDINGHWSEKAILSLTNSGIMSGYKDGTLKPDKKITRGEYVTLLNRLYKFEEKDDIHFSDVSKTLWCYDNISIAVKKGYVSGYPDGTFRPNNPITRAEASSMLARIIGGKSDIELHFKDEIPSWAEDSIKLLVSKGYISGYKDGTFGGDIKITRAEVATILYKVKSSSMSAIPKNDKMKNEDRKEIEKKKDDDKKDNKASSKSSRRYGGGGGGGGSFSKPNKKQDGNKQNPSKPNPSKPTPPAPTPGKKEITAKAKLKGTLLTTARYEITLTNAVKKDVSKVELCRKTDNSKTELLIQDTGKNLDSNTLFVIVNDIYEKPIKDDDYFIITTTDNRTCEIKNLDKVKIPEKEKVTVTFEGKENAEEITGLDSENKIEKNSIITFKVKATKDTKKVAKVTVDGSEVKPSDEVYIVKITKDTTIKVEYVDNKNVLPLEEDFIFIEKMGSITGYKGTKTDVIIPSQIKGIEVKIISKEAFKNKKIDYIKIPDSVTQISKDAFYSCGLKKIELGNKLNMIGERAFGYNELKEVVIPDSVKTIADYAFINNNISKLDLGKVEIIGGFAFSNNNLTYLTIPDTVTTIKERSFYLSKKNKISNLKLGKNVERIEQYAFSENEIKEVDIPNKVKFIGRSAFEKNKLSSITTPRSLIEIGSYAFGQNDLNSVTLNEGLQTIGNRAFEKNKLLREITIPDSVTSIGHGAFQDCGLLKVIIGNGVKSIGKYAFKNNQINNLVLGKNLEKIEKEAFHTNSNLKSLTIPPFVREINEGAFVSTGIIEVTVSNKAKIHENAFDTGVRINKN